MREAERLKNVLRSARTSTGRHESTAEHTWRLALLALVLADEKPELDLPRVLAMCLVHDLGEAYEGDIPAVAQCDPASKAAAAALPPLSAVRHAAPARARAASKSSDVPFLMCLSFCNQTLPQRPPHTLQRVPPYPRSLRGRTRRYCNGIPACKTRPGWAVVVIASSALGTGRLGYFSLKRALY